MPVGGAERSSPSPREGRAGRGLGRGASFVAHPTVSSLSHTLPTIHYCLKQLLWLGPVLFLWQGLIRHLSVEWTLNPQYAYGWAVPLLCAYLLWRELPPAGLTEPPERPDAGKWRQSTKSAVGIILALCYAPTRLIQEANPEWRLVSWSLAFEVVGLTWVLLGLVRLPRRADSSLRCFSPFPFFFFLIAVPWPTMVERPVIRSLTSAATQGTVELLGWLGIPALLHGNVIEIGSGMVGIDEACSGIRSFQAALMIALFFGQIYRLSLSRRILCLASAFALAILFNLLRTTLLAWIASTRGSNAIATWHDPAGISILLGCFAGIWGLAVYFRPLNQETLHNFRAQDMGKRLAFGLSFLPTRASVVWPLICWILSVELGTEVWYRVHERTLAHATRWHPIFAQDLAEFHELGFSATSRRFLRFDEGVNTSWQERSGLRWQAIFLRWDPGHVAVHLARNHTPEDCLTAAGQQVVAQSALRSISVHGLSLPFRCYVARDESGTVYVFYCLWEDRALQQSFSAEWLSYRNRLMPVLAGRRNCGQRSLELALWGAANELEADHAVRELLPKILEVED